MKKTILLMLVLILAACSPAVQPMPTITPVDIMVTVGEPTAAVPANTQAVIAPTETTMPTSTTEPAALPEPTTPPAPTASAEPVIDARFPMNEGTDGIGFGAVLAAMPGGQLWESTTEGGVRVYNSTNMIVAKSLDLGGQQYGLSRLVGDDTYVWVMFYGASDSADLFRVSRTDFSFQRVALPDDCTNDACQWSLMVLDDDILWVGGYDELWAFDRETMEPTAKFLFSEQAGIFSPSDIVDLEVTEDGQLWALFSTDVGYIVILDRQKVLDGVDQEPQFVYFVNNTVQFISSIGGAVLAGEGKSGNVEVQPAVLYRLEEPGMELSPTDGAELTEDQDFFMMAGMNITEDGRYIWVVDDGGRKLLWIDPEKGKVAGELEIYPGETPTEDDPNMIMSISFDGKYLWASGSEILRIALPWVE